MFLKQFQQIIGVQIHFGNGNKTTKNMYLQLAALTKYFREEMQSIYTVQKQIFSAFF